MPELFDFGLVSAKVAVGDVQTQIDDLTPLPRIEDQLDSKSDVRGECAIGRSTISFWKAYF